MFRTTITLATLLLLQLLSEGQDRGNELIAAPKNNTGTSYAIVMGISSYPNIKKLLYADDDAYLFSEFLVKQKICSQGNVKRLIDSVATAANFYKEIKRLIIKADSNDRVFIYFAGHGDVETDIESGFLLTYNCTSNNYPASDAIDISMLERYVNAFTRKNVKVVLITDACRAGNLAGGLSGANSTISSINEKFKNVVKILSCQPNQLSEEKYYQGGGHGIFTYHLVNGLNGLADRDANEIITVREIDFYLEEVGKETKNKQNPKIEGDPLLSLTKYDKNYMQHLIAKNDNPYNSLSVNNRGVDDTLWYSNEYYQSFTKLMNESKLVEPESNNAYRLIMTAIKNKQPADMVIDMKLELSATLEDEIQKWVNKYLRGELETVNPVILGELSKNKNYSARLIEITSKEDLRYNAILAKKIFFQVYYDFKMNNRSNIAANIVLLQKAEKLLPKQAWLKHALALLYRADKQTEKALATEKEAIKLSPTWSYPWHNLANIYLDLKRTKDAEASFNTSINLDSSDAYPWNNLGLIYMSQKKLAKAQKAYANAVKLDPNTGLYWNNYGISFLATSNKKQAAACFKKAVLLDPKSEARWQRLFESLTDKKEIEEWKKKKKKLQVN
ncbi:MAG: tetratricopeptide repeat protein [Ferruginibacter sp.]